MPIFDQGYQHWKGSLSGHAWRWLAVARHGVRTQLKSRIVRLLLLIAWLPAIALIVVLALWGLLEQRVESVLGFLGRLLPAGVIAEPQQYRTAVWTVAYAFFFQAEIFFSLFLVMAIGPNLISRDLRFNALPLYFSRPLRRVDYFCGKLGVLVSSWRPRCLCPQWRPTRWVSLSASIWELSETHTVSCWQAFSTASSFSFRPAPSCWPFRRCRAGQFMWASPGWDCGSSA